LRKSIALAVVAGVLTLTGAAQAATWRVDVGEQTRPPAGTPKGSTLDEFLPGRLVINAGDRVKFSSATFHTVAYLAGTKPQALFVPDPAHAKYEGINDAAGAPFYFNGLAKLIYNGAAFAPTGGKTIPDTGPVSSGVLSPSGSGAKPATVTYTFPKEGRYRLICTIHPGMKIDVAVKSAGAAVPLSPMQVKAEILTQTAAGWAAASKVVAVKPPALTVYMGVGNASTVLGFIPSLIKVKAGTAVRFVNRSPREVHNIAFGPLRWINGFMRKTDLLPQTPKAPNQVSPVYPYSTEPTANPTYDGANHGNGFLATRLTSGSSAIRLPRTSTVTFTKPGTYKYLCLIHGPDMSGTVVVTP
jgi:plastocyanin